MSRKKTVKGAEGGELSRAPVPSEKIAEAHRLGRFAPGESGNPSGHSPTFFEVVKLARANTPEAITRVVEIMRTADRASDRLKAAEIILDRGLGKAPQQVNVDLGLPATQLTDEALRIAAGEILAKLPPGVSVAAALEGANTTDTDGEPEGAELLPGRRIQ